MNYSSRFFFVCGRVGGGQRDNLVLSSPLDCLE